jgi:hypothetical protein
MHESVSPGENNDLPEMLIQFSPFKGCRRYPYEEAMR